MLRSVLAGSVLLATVAGLAVAQTIPVPKVMSDVPPDKGSWKMEALEMPGRQAEAMKRMGPMTICQTAAQAMARDDTHRQERCTQRLLEDGATRAVVETTCTGPDPMSMRSTITRTAPRAYEIATDTTQRGKTETMRMRMSYAGPCSEKDAVLSMPKSSPACQQGAAQMAAMNPEQACKGQAGAQREQCVQQMARARSQFEQMCK